MNTWTAFVEGLRARGYAVNEPGIPSSCHGVLDDGYGGIAIEDTDEEQPELCFWMLGELRKIGRVTIVTDSCEFNLSVYVPCGDVEERLFIDAGPCLTLLARDALEIAVRDLLMTE